MSNWFTLPWLTSASTTVSSSTVRVATKILLDNKSWWPWKNWKQHKSQLSSKWTLDMVVVPFLTISPFLPSKYCLQTFKSTRHWLLWKTRIVTLHSSGIYWVFHLVLSCCQQTLSVLWNNYYSVSIFCCAQGLSRAHWHSFSLLVLITSLQNPTHVRN